MRFKLLLLFTLLTSVRSQAQYVAVTFYPPPFPTNLWLAGVSQATTNVQPFEVLFLLADFEDYVVTNAASVAAWQTNASNPQVVANANFSRIVELFNQIPAARTQMTSIKNSTIGNVAAASTAIKTSANVIDGILEELQRLGPVLKEIYRPESDATQ